MKKLPLLALSFLGAVSAATAQTVSTDPVGFVSVSVKAASDAVIALPLHRPAALTTVVTAVAGNKLTVSAPLTASQFVYNSSTQTNTYFVKVASAGFEGRWYTVTANDATSVTVDPASVDSLQTQSFPLNSSIDVIPFWTLATLFPSGQSIDPSPDVNLPQGQIKLTNQVASGTNLAPNKTYIYHPGGQGPVGWYDLDDLDSGLKNDLPLLPDTYFIARNPGGAKSIVITGGVPMDDAATNVSQVTAGVSQDNFLVNPFPVAISLAESKLFETGAVVASPDVNSPKDLVLVFSETQSGYNLAPAGTYIYHSGEQGAAGWYNLNDLDGGTVNAAKILLPGRGFIVRKASTSTVAVTWTAPTTY